MAALARPRACDRISEAFNIHSRAGDGRSMGVAAGRWRGRRRAPDARPSPASTRALGGPCESPSWPGNHFIPLRSAGWPRTSPNWAPRSSVVGTRFTSSPGWGPGGEVGASRPSPGPLPPWGAVVPGAANGRVVECARLENLGGAPQEAIALVEEIEGDEVIPDGVVAILSRHDVPHLSHVAIRARERRVVFATCEDSRAWNEARRLTGSLARVEVSEDDTRIAPTVPPRSVRVAEDARQAPLPEAPVVVEPPGPESPLVLPLHAATLANAGAKAAGAGRLEVLARLPDAGFRTPSGVAVSFAALDRALGADPVTSAEYASLLRALGAQDPVADHARALARLRQLTRGLAVDSIILATVASRFGPDAPLVVRIERRRGGPRAGVGRGGLRHHRRCASGGRGGGDPGRVGVALGRAGVQDAANAGCAH